MYPEPCNSLHQWPQPDLSRPRITRYTTDRVGISPGMDCGARSQTADRLANTHAHLIDPRLGGMERPSSFLDPDSCHQPDSRQLHYGFPENERQASMTVPRTFTPSHAVSTSPYDPRYDRTMWSLPSPTATGVESGMNPAEMPEPTPSSSPAAGTAVLPWANSFSSASILTHEGSHLSDPSMQHFDFTDSISLGQIPHVPDLQAHEDIFESAVERQYHSHDPSQSVEISHDSFGTSFNSYPSPHSVESHDNLEDHHMDGSHHTDRNTRIDDDTKIDNDDSTIISPGTPQTRSSRHAVAQKPQQTNRRRMPKSSRRFTDSSKKTYPCVFAMYGCQKSFDSKNEWKRHINTQHMHFELWRCDKCEFRAGEKVKKFNRKDLFVSHVKRMHKDVLAEPRKRHFAVNTSDADDLQTSTDNARVDAFAARCQEIAYPEPCFSRCTFCGTGQQFARASSWSAGLDHIAKHMESIVNDGQSTVEHSAWLQDLGLERYLLDHGIIVQGRGRYILPSE